MTIWEDSPISPFDIGDEFTPVAGGAKLKVSKINISDSVIGERFGRPYRQWQITIEGDTNTQGSSDNPVNSNIQYSFVIEKNDEGIIKNSGSMEVINTGETPLFTVNVGEEFSVPGIGKVVCTKISGGDEYTESGTHRWKINYDGAAVHVNKDEEDPAASLPDNEESVSYELNGITTRSVSGEFIVLRRSQSPIKRMSLTRYTSNNSMLTTIGTAYSDGIAISEQITKETIKSNDVVIGTYYRHDIEVEA